MKRFNISFLKQRNHISDIPNIIDSNVGESLRRRTNRLSYSIEDDKYFYVNNEFKNIKQLETYIVSNIKNHNEYENMYKIIKELEKEQREIEIHKLLKRIDNSIDSFHFYGLLIVLNIGIITFLMAN